MNLFSKNTPQLRKLISIDKLFFERKTRSAAATVLDTVAREYPFPIRKSNTSLLESVPFLGSIKSREVGGDFRAHESGRIELVLYRDLGSGTSATDKGNKERVNTLV